MEAPEERIRVVRVLVFEGERKWIEGTLERSWLQPDLEPKEGPTTGWIAQEVRRTIEVL